MKKLFYLVLCFFLVAGFAQAGAAVNLPSKRIRDKLASHRSISIM